MQATRLRGMRRIICVFLLILLGIRSAGADGVKVLPRPEAKEPSQPPVWVAVPGFEEFFIVTPKALLHLQRSTLEVSIALAGADFESIRALYDTCNFDWLVAAAERRIHLHRTAQGSDACTLTPEMLAPRPLILGWELVVDGGQPAAPPPPSDLSNKQYGISLAGGGRGVLTLDPGAATVSAGERKTELRREANSMGRFSLAAESDELAVQYLAEYDPASGLFLYDTALATDKGGWWTVTLFTQAWQVVDELYLFRDGALVARRGSRIAYRDAKVLERLLVYRDSGEALRLDDRLGSDGPAAGLRVIDLADAHVLSAAAPAWRLQKPALVAETGYDAPARCVALSKSGEFALIWHADDVFRYWALTWDGPLLLRAFTVPNLETAYQEDVRAFSLSPNGRFAAVSGGEEVGYVSVLDLDLGEELFRKQPSAGDLSFADDASLILVSPRGDSIDEQGQVSTVSVPEGATIRIAAADASGYQPTQDDRGLRKCAPYDASRDAYAVEPSELLDKTQAVPAEWTFDFGATKVVQTKAGLFLARSGEPRKPFGTGLLEARALGAPASGTALLVAKASGGLLRLDLAEARVDRVDGVPGVIARSGLINAPPLETPLADKADYLSLAVDETGTLYTVNAATGAATGLKLPLFGSVEGLLIAPAGDKVATFVPSLQLGYEVDLRSLRGHFVFPTEAWDHFGVWHYGYYASDLTVGAPVASLIRGSLYRLTSSVALSRQNLLIAAVAEPAAGPGLGVRLWCWSLEDASPRPFKESDALCNGEMTLPATGTALAAHPKAPLVAAGTSIGTLDVFDYETGQRLWSRQDAHVREVLSILPVNGGSLFASSGADGLVHFWSGGDGRLVASLAAAGDDWAIFAPDGAFEGSTGVESRLHVAWGPHAFAFAPISEPFRRADLLRRRFSGADAAQTGAAGEAPDLAALLLKQLHAALPKGPPAQQPRRKPSEPAAAQILDPKAPPRDAARLEAGLARLGIAVRSGGAMRWGAAIAALQRALYADKARVTGSLTDDERRFVQQLADLPDPAAAEDALRLTAAQRARVSFELEKGGLGGYRGSSLAAFTPKDRLRILRNQIEAKAQATGYLEAADLARLTAGPEAMGDLPAPAESKGHFGDWTLALAELPADGGGTQIACVISTPAKSATPLHPIRPLLAVITPLDYFAPQVVADETRLLRAGVKVKAQVEPASAAAPAVEGQAIEEVPTDLPLAKRIWPQLKDLALIGLSFDDDSQLAAFVKGAATAKSLTVDGAALEGRLALTFSLDGFPAAYEALEHQCKR